MYVSNQIPRLIYEPFCDLGTWTHLEGFFSPFQSIQNKRNTEKNRLRTISNYYISNKQPPSHLPQSVWYFCQQPNLLRLAFDSRRQDAFECRCNVLQKCSVGNFRECKKNKSQNRFVNIIHTCHYRMVHKCEYNSWVRGAVRILTSILMPRISLHGIYWSSYLTSPTAARSLNCILNRMELILRMTSTTRVQSGSKC